MIARAAPPLVLLLVACSSSAGDAGAPSDAAAASSSDGPSPELPPQAASDGGLDATTAAFDASAVDAVADVGVGGAIPCSADGDLGECMPTSSCAARTGYTSFPGYCAGPSSIQCCAPTPDVASNPPIPAGYQPMQQSQVTTDMTNWAVSILNDPTDYPMFSTATRVFGALTVLARVEWHPPDFQNGVVHRGVTLYVPIDGG